MVERAKPLVINVLKGAGSPPIGSQWRHSAAEAAEARAAHRRPAAGWCETDSQTDQIVSPSSLQGRSLLLCRVGSRLVGLPLEHVAETMRMLPLEPLAGAPAFVSGVSFIRGETVPVVHAGLLLGAAEASPSRLVSLEIGDRRIALAVDAVLGIRALTGDALRALPPLLANASGGAISAVGALDSELLLVLESARLVPDSAWPAFDERQAA
jgi:purine-binding chemotaxis protein CheW